MRDGMQQARQAAYISRWKQMHQRFCGYTDAVPAPHTAFSSAHPGLPWTAPTLQACACVAIDQATLPQQTRQGPRSSGQAQRRNQTRCHLRCCIVVRICAPATLGGLSPFFTKLCLHDLVFVAHWKRGHLRKPLPELLRELVLDLLIRQIWPLHASSAQHSPCAAEAAEQDQRASSEFFEKSSLLVPLRP
jgi:hypothetical protein